MKFRALVRHRDSGRPVGPWRRRYTAALADARADMAPFKPYIWSVEDSHGRARDLGESQCERGLEQYDEAIANRDAVGVWG